MKEENLQTEYLITAFKMYYGFPIMQTWMLAWYAKIMHKIIPKTWEDNTFAGIDWLRGFMGRNWLLSLWNPEAANLSSATAFNKPNVDNFFHNLQTALQKQYLSQHHVYNCDETGLMTVVRPP